MKITLPLVPPSLNKLRKMHFQSYKRLRDDWQRHIFLLTLKTDIRALRAKVDLKSRMKVKITVEHMRKFDYDNLVGGCKPLLDSLKRLDFIVDDSEEWLVLEVKQEKGQANQTVIEIIPL